MTRSIQLSRVLFPVTALGPGVRLGIWVQGCHLACPGCMSRDTWDAAGGTRVPMADLADIWVSARRRGATGLTISGGEPAEQAGQVAELVSRIRQADAELARCRQAEDHSDGPPPAAPLDVLIFSGLNEDEFRATCPELAKCADAAVLGPFDITRPESLVWRGSGNQRLVTFTALGAERYGPYLTAATTSPAMQVVVEADRIWAIGIPRIGDLPRLERRLRERGLELGTVSWRP